MALKYKSQEFLSITFTSLIESIKKSNTILKLVDIAKEKLVNFIFIIQVQNLTNRAKGVIVQTKREKRKSNDRIMRSLMTDRQRYF